MSKQKTELKVLSCLTRALNRYSLYEVEDALSSLIVSQWIILLNLFRPMPPTLNYQH